MRSLLVAIVALVGCREAGTVTIELPAGFDDCGATEIRAYLAEDGVCDRCTCMECPICGPEGTKCTPYCEDVDGQERCTLSLADVRARGGISMRPPQSGNYAAVFEYTSAGQVRTFVCAEFDVEADGTVDKTIQPTKIQSCCPSPSAAGEPLRE